MTAREAIREASWAVCPPQGSRTSWCVTGPYDSALQSGPSTSVQADSYAGAIEARRLWVARVALCLLGVPSRSAELAVDWVTDGERGKRTVRGVVSAARAWLASEQGREQVQS